MNAERIDRCGAFAETFEQLEHAADVRLIFAVPLPAHVIVVDELRVRSGFARRVEHEVEEGFAAEHTSDVRIANEPGLRLHRFVDDVIGIDARAITLADRCHMG